MISFEDMQIGKLYYMHSFDYNEGKYYKNDIVFILSKSIDKNYGNQEVVDYLLGNEEYSIYFAYAKFWDIKI